MKKMMWLFNLLAFLFLGNIANADSVEGSLNQCHFLNYSSVDGKIIFDMLAMELYNPITDKSSGQFALFTGEGLSMKAFSGFNDFKYEGNELTYADKIIKKSDNCYPTYSAQEKIVHFPQVEVPLVGILPNGNSVDGFSICYEAFLKQANTKNMVFTLTQMNEIPCDTGNVGISCELTVDNVNEDIQVTTEGSFTSSITALDGWVITWSHADVYMQRYDSCSKKVGEKILVNTTTAAIQWIPSIISLQNGGYIIFWYSEPNAGSDISARSYMQRYGANGEKQGTETSLFSYLYKGTSRNNFSVSAMPNDGFIIAWHNPMKKQIIIQRYNALDEKVGNEIIIEGNQVAGTNVTGLHIHPAITVLDDGSWVVAWHKYVYPDSQNQNGIYIQHYDVEGNSQAIQKIDSYPSNNGYKPELIALHNGGWLVSIPNDGDTHGVNLQHYDSNGIKVTDKLMATDHEFGPGILSSSIIELQNGDWVVAWESLGKTEECCNSGIYLRV